MPDFDAYEREFRAAMTGPFDELHASAARIHGFAESQKVAMIRGRTCEEVQGFLERSHRSLRSMVNAPDPVFTYSSDNRAGKDLRESTTGLDIELKSGALMTNANLGVGTVAWMLGDDTKDLHAIMNDSMKQRRLLAHSPNCEAKIESSKSETMNALAHYLARLAPAGHPAPSKLSAAVRAIAAGHTTKKAMSNALSRFSTTPPLLLMSSWDEGLKPYGYAFLPSEQIAVVESGRAHQQRARLLLRGVESGVSVELYPNYKNGYKDLPASYWVSTACFHVWLGRHAN